MRSLNELLPPSGPVLKALNRVDPAPSIAGPATPVAPPDARIASRPRRVAARPLGGPRARHRLRARRRGLGLGGRAGPRRHQRPRGRRRGRHHGDHPDRRLVRRRRGPLRPEQRPRLLQIRDRLPPLPIAPHPKRGQNGAVLGYPENGPYSASPARFGETQDGDQRGLLRPRPDPPLDRLPARRVRSGNSGGPMVDSRGRVLGTVFAATTFGRPGGFAIPDDVVDAALAGPGAKSTRVRAPAEPPPLHFRAVNSPACGGAASPSRHPHAPPRAVAVVAFVIGAIAGAPGSPEKEAAERFPRPGRRSEFAAMYRELNAASKRAIDQRFRHRPPGARRLATLRSLEADSPGTPIGGRDDRGPGADGRGHGRLRHVESDLELPYDDGGIAWDPSLVFPGLRARRAPREPDRAGAAGADPRGRRDAPGRGRRRNARTPDRQRRDRRHRRSRQRRRRRPAVAAATGVPARRPVGVSGLEQAFNARLAGKPGRLAAGGRRQRRLGTDPRRGRTEARGAGEDDDRPRAAGIGGVGPRRPLRAASPSSTRATATSARSPARPSRRRSRPVPPSR